MATTNFPASTSPLQVLGLYVVSPPQPIYELLAVIEPRVHYTLHQLSYKNKNTHPQEQLWLDAVEADILVCGTISP